MVGYSLSFCVRDIIFGMVCLKNVEKIITGTKYESWEDWDDAVNSYVRSYWSHNPMYARAVLAFLLANGKIEQPRLLGEQAPDINASIFEERWK